MPIIHLSRTGKSYYLHTGPAKGGRKQYFFSTKSEGALADRIPEGFEVYEAIHGQVFLRRIQPKLITDAEVEVVRRRLAKPRAGFRYKVEAQGAILTIYESEDRSKDLYDMFAVPEWKRQSLNEQFAYYQGVLRFLLVDADKRLFAPERYCFKGSVHDWISIGSPDTVEKLAARFLKHLGKDSLYELY